MGKIMEPVKSGKSSSEHHPRSERKKNHGLETWLRRLVGLVDGHRPASAATIILTLAGGIVLIKDHSPLFAVVVWIAGILIWTAFIRYYYVSTHSIKQLADDAEHSSDVTQEDHREPPANALAPAESRALIPTQPASSPIVSTQPQLVPVQRPSPAMEAKPIPRVLGEKQRDELIEELRKMGPNAVRIESNASYDPIRFADELAAAFRQAGWNPTRPPNIPGGFSDEFGMQLSVPPMGDKRHFLQFASILWKCGILANIQPSGGSFFVLKVGGLEDGSDTAAALADMKSQIEELAAYRFVNDDDRKKLCNGLMFMGKMPVQVFCTAPSGEISQFGNELSGLFRNTWPVPMPIASTATFIQTEPALIGLKIMTTAEDSQHEIANDLSGLLTAVQIKNSVTEVTANKLTVIVGSDWRTTDEKEKAFNQFAGQYDGAIQRLRDSLVLTVKPMIYNDAESQLTFTIELKSSFKSPLRVKSLRYVTQIREESDASEELRSMDVRNAKEEQILGPNGSATFSSNRKSKWPSKSTPAGWPTVAIGKIWILDADFNMVALQYGYQIRRNENDEFVTDDIPDLPEIK